MKRMESRKDKPKVTGTGKKPRLHDQDWRDFQPTEDPDTPAEKFKAALERARRRVKPKGKPLAADSTQTRSSS